MNDHLENWIMQLTHLNLKKWCIGWLHPTFQFFPFPTLAVCLAVEAECLWEMVSVTLMLNPKLALSCLQKWHVAMHPFLNLGHSGGSVALLSNPPTISVGKVKALIVCGKILLLIQSVSYQIGFLLYLPTKEQLINEFQTSERL